MAAICLIPKDKSFSELKELPRSEWDCLSMNEADKLVCEFYGDEVDEKYYCRGWFDRLWNFAWYYCADKSKDNYSVTFPTLNGALAHYISVSLQSHQCSDEDIWTRLEEIERYTKRAIEPILKLFYDKGYKLVSLNIG